MDTKYNNKKTSVIPQRQRSFHARPTDPIYHRTFSSNSNASQWTISSLNYNEQLYLVKFDNAEDVKLVNESWLEPLI